MKPAMHWLPSARAFPISKRWSRNLLFGAKYVGKKGSKKGIVTWTCVSMAITSVLILFFIFTDTRQIGVIGSWNMIVYVLLTLLQNGSNMCITTSNNSYMADTIDYELDRSGRYIPAVVSGTYSLIDKLITSVAAVIATGAVAILGYTTTMPQPTDAYTSGIFWMTLAIKYGLPMLGWVITLIAMPGCPLTKEEMVNVQKRIADKKDALRHEVIAEHGKRVYAGDHQSYSGNSRCEQLQPLLRLVSGRIGAERRVL